MDKFKQSPKSICHTCSNIKEVCSLKTWMQCDTDAKAGVAYVNKCDKYNLPLNQEYDRKKNTVQVAYKSDTRVEMMGGGHNDPDKK